LLWYDIVLYEKYVRTWTSIKTDADRIPVVSLRLVASWKPLYPKSVATTSCCDISYLRNRNLYTIGNHKVALISCCFITIHLHIVLYCTFQVSHVPQKRPSLRRMPQRSPWTEAPPPVWCQWIAKEQCSGNWRASWPNICKSEIVEYYIYKFYWFVIYNYSFVAT
jgi:hypothetical protein